MKIAIVGAGMVGESLAKALTKAKYEVMVSSRTPDSDKMKALAAELGVKVGTVEETLQFSEVVAVALRWDAVADVVKNPSAWAGKTVLDMMNRFGGGGKSHSEEFAALIPQAKIVKVFNTIGAEHYVDPNFGEERASMLFCGDDVEAKKVVGQLVHDLHFDPVDIGGLKNAHLLDSLAQLWVTMARELHHGREFAFRLIRKYYIDIVDEN